MNDSEILALGKKRAEARIKSQSVRQSNGCIFMRGQQKARPAIEVNKRQYLVSRHLLMNKLGRELSPLEFACHSCDEPRCINLKHIFIGSRSDNMKDAGRKGRTYMQRIRGTAKARNHARKGWKASINSRSNAKLTPEQVKAIRKAHWRKGHNYSNSQTLADAYGVTKENINSIIRGETWKSV